MQCDWSGLRLYTVIGDKYYLTLPEMREGLIHPLTLIFMVLAAATLVLFDVHGYASHMAAGGTVLLWTVCTVTLVGFYVAIIGALVSLSKRFSWVVVYLPVVGVIATSLNTILTMNNASMLMGMPFALQDVLVHLPQNILAGFIFESLYSIFAMPLVNPRLMASVKHVAPRALRPAVRSISIGGQVLNLKSISVISSQDHYLEVVSIDGTILLRGRLSDALTQLSVQDGISPHRSYWVASSFIKGIGGKSGARTLVLHDGVELPIARARVLATQKWLADRENQNHRH